MAMVIRLAFLPSELRLMTKSFLAGADAKEKTQGLKPGSFGGVCGTTEVVP